MTIDNLLQNFANATGIVVDRTFNPPRVLGQAFLVSKSRMVTCAGCIFNHAETPWALAVKFPHPNITLGVKSIALHPDFDRKEARSFYLNQTASSKFTYPVQFNDLATMVVQSEIREPDLELVGQLHRALSVPFSSEGVQSSGAIQGTDFQNVVKNILNSGQSGLITLFDELNIPIAYLQVTPKVIERVYFQGIAGEMAFSELIYRQAGKGFSFRANENFVWGELRKIEMPAQDLLAESQKRAQELPSMLSSVGGSEARYQKVVQEFKVEVFNQSVQWLVNNLWQAIDGYITVDQLSERVGADTYTVVQGLRELSNRGIISLINRESPFNMSGQLGTPIVSHTDFDINPGDSLKSFYLDPVSGAPCWQDGNFAGVASVLQSKNLLHSIPIPLKVPGALILKNYRLIGVHNGLVPVKPGQVNLERQLYQMMWIGALFDMSSKKLRGALDQSEESNVNNSGTKLTSLRDIRGGGAEEEKAPIAEKLAAFICPNCFANNTKLGNCFNCGALIESAPVVPEKLGFFDKTMPIPAISNLQEKYHIADKHIFAAVGGVVGLFILLIVLISTHNSSPGNSSAPVVKVERKNDEKAAKLASSIVGFKETPPTGYSYVDTSPLTSPLASFGLFSEASNQKIIFVVFNDMSTISALDRFTQVPPFSDVIPPTNPDEESIKRTPGSQIVGESNFNYYIRNYPTSTNSTKTMLVGSFPAKEAGKSVLVLGQTLNAGVYDYKSTLFLVDNLAESLTKAANAKLIQSTKSANTTESESLNKSTKENAEPSKDQIDQYCQTIQDKLQKKINNESDILDQVKKERGKLKVVLEVDLDKDGNFTKMEIAEPDLRQKTNDDLVKVISSLAPFPNVPKVQGGVLNLRIVFKNGNFKIETRD